jgi:Spy/CpxP family protein refolding chaperone
MALAQTPSTGPQPGKGKAAMGPRAKVRRRVVQALNLTDAQKQQAKTIFQQARQSEQPLAQELKQNRQALRDAVKAGKGDGEILQLAVSRGHILGQVTAVRTQALAKFYSTLTPDQRARAGQTHLKIRQIVKKRLQRRGNG